MYIDTRYISAPEAVWRLREFKVSDKSHQVFRLAVHLQLEQTVRFNPTSDLNEVLQKTVLQL